VDGKYEMLLRQLKVPQDAAAYGDFRDLGKRTMTQYAGFDGLPYGHWVYVNPCWYIWRDLRSAPVVKRAFGPEQATGPPDTPLAGDCNTAWASLGADNQDEWLLLEYAEPVLPAAVLIYETFNPGAVHRVTAFRLSGEEVEVWKGKDPTPVGSDRGISEIPLKMDFKTNRLRIHIHSTAVPGWNEIDAVGLRGPSGKILWATAAEASSTYAQPAVQALPFLAIGGGFQGQVIIRQAVPVPRVAPVPPPAPALPPPPAPFPAAPPPARPPADPNAERIRNLEKEVYELRQQLLVLKRLNEQLKKEAERK
jgi:hypothetical protein